MNQLLTATQLKIGAKKSIKKLIDFENTRVTDTE